MYPISDACAAALRSSHTRVPVCEIFEGFGRMLASTYSSPRLEIDSTIGEIRTEYGAVHCRSFSATVLDADGVLVPDTDMGWLDPLTRPQLQFWSEIGWEDDLGFHTERIPTGRFILGTNNITEVGGDGVTMEITGNSRSSTAIQDNHWTEPFAMSSGVSYDLAIIAALQDRTLPGWSQQFSFRHSLNVMPIGVQLMPSDSGSPWEDLQAMAVSDAAELLEGPTGEFILRAPWNVATLAIDDATWTYDATPLHPDASSYLPGAKRSVDIANAYNGAIVNGSAPWLISPVQGVAWDENPGSPTYFKGPFGMRAQTFSDDTVGDEVQADAVALQKLSTVLGVSEEISIEVLPNPAHGPGDPIILTTGASKIDDIVILKSFTLPFNVQTTMPITINRLRK